MLYLATPSSPDIRAAMSAGYLGCMTTPAQGNKVPDGALYACDNGKFGKGWPGTERWFAWLVRTVTRYGADRCLWAVAPDVPFDAAGTLIESLPWLARIRDLGVPAAFAAQDGCDQLDGGLPWNAFDVLFLAGSTEWKTSPTAERLAREARERGKQVHMGRVNSRRRLGVAGWFGVDSCDGTYLAFGPARNLPTLMGWLGEIGHAPTLCATDRHTPQPRRPAPRARITAPAPPQPEPTPALPGQQPLWSP
ncbi:hypothetical protein [Streptomyces sp. NRRL F-5630]|uniref:hypothetical protein n=1 Tax=Streptomyces sp. NRRL F-5630 TaxID=1463864 RepID=UPI003EC04A5B